tara:strand:+ start:374 stop:535 length:162 start_codon:yes stop_codon:yes gene_type:complete
MRIFRPGRLGDGQIGIGRQPGAGIGDGLPNLVSLKIGECRDVFGLPGRVRSIR